MLVQRAMNGQRRYALANQTVAQEARRLGGRTVERRYQAEDELERVWSAWLARDVPATRGQLRYLAEAGGHLTPKPVKVLLLLRSAVAWDMPAAPWLAWLRSDAGRALIRELEDPDAPGLTQRSSRSTLDKAALLLGLHDITLPDQPGNGSRPFGLVAWSAVTHPEQRRARQRLWLSWLWIDTRPWIGWSGRCGLWSQAGCAGDVGLNCAASWPTPIRRSRS